MNKKYKAYLLSDEWRNLKIDLIQQRGYKCERCNKKTKLIQVHHLTYERIYNENQEDLILLCGICHQKAHGLIKEKVKPSKKPVKKKTNKKVKSIWQIVEEAKKSSNPSKFVKAYNKASKRI